ncbi:MAG: metallophosphoesterase [Armatimonadetes bacterium]|nr:metallophosphoesterase [Armatimonadota bacterium]
MKAVDLVNFFRSPADRDIISRWTMPPGPRPYALDLPQPEDPERFEFLALGDTGDSAGSRSQVSPQDAVGALMAEDAALPGKAGAGRFVLHMGDVVYMTGERRLYDRNFRRPYADFLTPESTVDSFTFRLPFLPVPGNHDYYDFSGWGAWLSRLPFVGRGIAAVARELFSMQVPEGGSDQGAAYMHAFVDGKDSNGSAEYVLGERTRVPNRYYRFRVGKVDFFALDSNTLESPPPSADLAAERENAAHCVKELEKRAAALTRQIDRDKKALEAWLEQERKRVVADVTHLDSLQMAAGKVEDALAGLAAALRAIDMPNTDAGEVLGLAEEMHRQWSAAATGLASRGKSADAVERLADVGDDICRLLEKLEYCFAELPDGPERESLTEAREALLQGSRGWCAVSAGPPPAELCARIQKLTTAALDVQRHLAVEHRRMGRQPEDYDTAQLEWLRASIEESVRDNPDGWRIVFLHQPLYTSIGDHSENPDVLGMRENLIPLLRDKVHLVLAGHAHAFEWFRSTQLPHTGLIVTGGGGQRWLWASILEPRKFRRFQNLYHSLREGGATECVAAGNGPRASDGAGGPLYHYVRIEVTPDVLRVHPVGVRKAGSGYRREAPMPVFHVPDFPPDERPAWNRRILKCVEIRKAQPPRPVWG